MCAQQAIADDAGTPPCPTEHTSATNRPASVQVASRDGSMSGGAVVQPPPPDADWVWARPPAPVGLVGGAVAGAGMSTPSARRGGASRTPSRTPGRTPGRTDAKGTPGGGRVGAAVTPGGSLAPSRLVPPRSSFGFRPPPSTATNPYASEEVRRVSRRRH